MTAALGCFYCNTRSSLSLRLLLVWCPSHAIVDLHICDYKLRTTCLPTLSFCSVNRMSGKVALFNSTVLHINTLKQEGQALACCMSRRPPPHWSSGMLEDYLVEHLPAVGQLDACGCELTLVDADTHQVLCDPIHDELWNNMRFHLVAQDCFQSYSCKEQIQRDVYEAHPRDLCPCQ